MKITIDKLLGVSTVEITSPIGTFRGEWIGETPQLGEYEVELSIDHISSVKFTDKVKDIYISSGKTFVTGMIEDEDDDDIRYLRLGGDLVMVDITGLSLKNRIVEIETDEIKFFPI